MKDLIRNILREEVAKNTNLERYMNPLKKYIAMRSLPDFVCYTNVIQSEHAIIILFQYISNNRYDINSIYSPTVNKAG